MKELSITIKVAIAGPEDNYTIGERGRALLEKYLDPVKLQALLTDEIKAPIANITVALNVTEMQPEDLLVNAIMSHMMDTLPSGASEEQLESVIANLQSHFGDGVQVGIKRVKIGDDHQSVKTEDLKTEGNVTYLPTKDKPSVH